MKAALYLRIGVGQQSLSDSIAANQKATLMALAQEQGMVVQKVYEDIGFSGVTFDRPALQALLHDAKEGQMDCVFAVNLSRLGRDSYQMAEFVKQLQESGVQVKTPYGAVGGDLLSGGLLQQLTMQA